MRLFSIPLFSGQIRILKKYHFLRIIFRRLLIYELIPLIECIRIRFSCRFKCLFKVLAAFVILIRLITIVVCIFSRVCDLRRDVTSSIKRLMDIGCYSGLRHRRGLPVNGQRTHTNARTRKGPRHGAASKKK